MGDRTAKAFIVLGIIAIASYFLSQWNFLFFHFTAELFSIVVAVSIYVITQFFWQEVENIYVKMWAISSMWTAVLDLFHMLTYKGLTIFPNSYGNSAAQLWIAARLFQAITFIVPIIINIRKPSSMYLHLIYGLLVFILISSILWWEIFPVCYIDGIGLTPFKIISEIIALDGL